MRVFLLLALLGLGCDGGESALAPCKAPQLEGAQCEAECAARELPPERPLGPPCTVSNPDDPTINGCASVFDTDDGRTGCCGRTGDAVRFFECLD